MSCPQCFSGHINPGTPLGRIEDVYGRSTYIADPPDGKQPKGIIVIIPDAFGQEFVNNQILADHYASMGQYRVYLPDFMDGEWTCSRLNLTRTPFQAFWGYVIRALRLTSWSSGKAAQVSTMINMAYLWDKNTSWLSTPYVETYKLLT